MSEQLSPGSKRWQQLAQVFFLLLLSATPLCSWAKDEDLIPKIPIPVLHSYKPSEGPIFESWATERGLSRREIPQPENFATGSGAPLTWKPIPDQPQESPANARTTLRTRLRNHKKENAPPGPVSLCPFMRCQETFVTFCNLLGLECSVSLPPLMLIFCLCGRLCSA